MELYQLIPIALVTLVAGLVQSVTGFGFGIVAMIFLPSLLLFTEANVLSAILSTVTSALALISTIKKTTWKNLIFPLVGNLITNYFTIKFMAGIENKVLTLLLGIALFALSVYFFFFSDKIKIRPTWYAGIIAGAVSGILNGLFSIGGPPVVVYYLQSEKSTESYFATISAYFVLSGILSISMKAVSGFITYNVLICLAICLVTMLIGSITGKKIREKTKPKLVRKAVYFVMAISGAVNIFTSLN